MPKRSSIEYTNKVLDGKPFKSYDRNAQRKNVETLGSLFQIIGDLTRVKILFAISDHELCVSDICYILNMSYSAVSHQLRALKKARIIKNRRDGKNIYYSLADEHITQIFNMGLKHISEIID